MRDCTLRLNKGTITTQFTELDVFSSTIEDNLRGFFLFNGDIFLNGNTIRDNDRDGLYSFNCVVDMFHTVIENNGLQNSGYRGIYATYSSDIALGVRDWDQDEGATGGYNTVKNNHGAGVYQSSSSMVLLGDIIPWNQDTRAGNNSIHDNGLDSGTYNGIDVWNAGGAMV